MYEYFSDLLYFWKNMPISYGNVHIWTGLCMCSIIIHFNVELVRAACWTNTHGVVLQSFVLGRQRPRILLGSIYVCMIYLCNVLYRDNPVAYVGDTSHPRSTVHLNGLIWRYQTRTCFSGVGWLLPFLCHCIYYETLDPLEDIVQ